MKRPLAFASAAALLGLGNVADAQPRCDCSSIVGTCAAEVDVRGSLIEVTTDRRECARVDYLVDGQPFVTLAVDGAGRDSVNVPTAAPRVTIKGCRICADSTAVEGGASGRDGAPAPARTPVPQPPPAPPDAPLRPLIQVQPEYPETAAEQGIEGWVELAVTIGESGIVEDVRVLMSAPDGVFEPAARAAVQRWRYPPIAESRTLVERIEFRIPADPLPPAVRAAPAASAERDRDGPRSSCVREASRFGFDDRVEVALINTCAEPLAVFGCSPGTARYRGRWSCTASELTGTVLVPQTDERAGSTARTMTDDGSTTTTYSSRLLVARAPSSEHWWLACGLDDAACLDAGRDWVRSLDGQLENANPQGRSRVPLARSF